MLVFSWVKYYCGDYMCKKRELKPVVLVVKDEITECRIIQVDKKTEKKEPKYGKTKKN